MPSKQQDEAKSKISPVLFMTVSGEPMSFFLRPGPVKRKLQPLITAGGGMLCNVQKPGAILLIDPEERASVSETTAHWYISTQYVHDCIEKDEQLTLEDYRLNPEVEKAYSTRLRNSKESPPASAGGRTAYTAKEDAAILNYVRKHKTEAGGNKLWQEMEKQRVTSHSWQSMKYRYRVRLAHKLSESEEKQTKGDGNLETEAQSSSSNDADVSPKTHSEGPEPVKTDTTETELTQIDAQPISDESTQAEDAEAQTSTSPQEEVQVVNPLTKEQPVEGTQVETVEAETSNCSQLEEQCWELETNTQLALNESPEPEAVEPTISPETGDVPEDHPPSQPDSLLETPSQNVLSKKQKASPKEAQGEPPTRVTRRQLKLEGPQPYNKKLRSSSTPNKSSPEPSKKTKLSIRSAHQKDITADQPPVKRARGKGGAKVLANEQEESEENGTSKTEQPGDESSSVTQKGQKKTEKRKLGILELATKEFEDDSEADEDESPDLQNKTETVAMQSALTSDPSSDVPSSVLNYEHGATVQEPAEDTQASSGCHLAEVDVPEPAEFQTVASEPAPSEPAPSEVHTTSKAHLFIFDHESQEEDSESLVGDGAAHPPDSQTKLNGDTAPSLTQAQLEEDKQRIRDLMNQTNQDLASVTKALLKTSGDWSAALDLLLDPSSFSGPFWTYSDDSLLDSADPDDRHMLQEKYGEEGVAKRLVFLAVEGSS
ncbi:telomeric repeat-binding factor 2-interacting protein 1 isoform X2 [Sphaeramia orbicularis]|nr:telomeric repeat-binding factor 2-interacting protein 1 isoform X2 [Sphaeramia orbicularis]